MKLRHAFAVGTWAVLISAAAHAEDWSLSTWHAGPRSSVAYESSGIAAQRAKPRRYRGARSAANHRQYVQTERDVRLYRHDEKPRRHVQCLDRVTVVGSQWANEAGAEESAQKAFMEQVRWQSGEQFLDIRNADGYAKRCSRSSIGEVIGQTMHRCEVSARPCRPVMERAEAK